MTTLYVVHSTTGGFAREDAAQSTVEGAYTDEAVARKVAALVGGWVATVTLNKIAPGYLNAAQEMGILLRPTSTPLARFEQIYKAVATRENHVRPSHPQMDNWAVDRYERADGYFAGMMDNGYYKYVGLKIDGKQVWRVSCAYTSPSDALRYDNISCEDFATMEFQ